MRDAGTLLLKDHSSLDIKATAFESSLVNCGLVWICFKSFLIYLIFGQSCQKRKFIIDGCLTRWFDVWLNCWSFCNWRKLKFCKVEESTSTQAIYLCVHLLYICVREPSTTSSQASSNYLGTLCRFLDKILMILRRESFSRATWWNLKEISKV